MCGCRCGGYSLLVLWSLSINPAVCARRKQQQNRTRELKSNWYDPEAENNNFDETQSQAVPENTSPPTESKQDGHQRNKGVFPRKVRTEDDDKDKDKDEDEDKDDADKPSPSVSSLLSVEPSVHFSAMIWYIFARLVVNALGLRSGNPRHELFNYSIVHHHVTLM